MLREIACQNMTILGLKQVNNTVNFESDLIGKYVERLLQERGCEGLAAKLGWSELGASGDDGRVALHAHLSEIPAA
jgi:hypothetical protein